MDSMSSPSSSSPAASSDLYAATATWGFEDCDIDQPESWEGVLERRGKTTQRITNSTPAIQTPEDTPTAHTSPDSWAAMSKNVSIAPVGEGQSWRQERGAGWSTATSQSQNTKPAQSMNDPTPHEKILPPLPVSPQLSNDVTVGKIEDYLGSRQR